MSSTVSTSANSVPPTVTPVSRRAASVRHRSRPSTSGRREGTPRTRVGDAEDPPPAVARRTQDRVGRPQRARALAEQVGGHLRGVHADLHDGRTACRGRGVGVGVGQPVGEIVAALFDDGEVREPLPDLGTAAGRVQITGHGDDARRDGRGRDGVECVQQGGGGDVCGRGVAERGGQPRLRQSGNRCLRDHQHRHPPVWPQEITRQKSSIARKLPRTEPLTFDFPPVREP